MGAFIDFTGQKWLQHDKVEHFCAILKGKIAYNACAYWLSALQVGSLLGFNGYHEKMHDFIALAVRLCEQEREGVFRCRVHAPVGGLGCGKTVWFNSGPSQMRP